MSVKGVITEKKVPPTGIRTTSDGISGLVLHAVAVVGKFVLGDCYKLQGLRDAKALGIDEDYDNTNNVLVYYHIKEYYEMVALDSNTPLYIMGVAQSVAFGDMIEDTTSIYGKKLALFAKGEIKQFGFGNNPTAYAPTLANGVDAALLVAIAKAQTLHSWSLDNAMPFEIVLEGKNGWTGTATAMQDFTAISGVQAPNVAVTFAQDWEQGDKKTIWNKHAAVGTVLGAIAARRVNESIGWVEVGNIQDVARGRWIKPAFSNHILIEAKKEDWQTLQDKAVIVPLTYANSDGVFFNTSKTCVAQVTDAEGYINEWNIEYGRTLNKAIRSVYAALLPSVKSPQPVDATTGKLDIGVVAFFKGKAESRIDADLANEISGRAVFIDKNSDLINAPRELKSGVTVVPFGATDVIRVNIALKNRI